MQLARTFDGKSPEQQAAARNRDDAIANVEARKALLAAAETEAAEAKATFEGADSERKKAFGVLTGLGVGKLNSTDWTAARQRYPAVLKQQHKSKFDKWAKMVNLKKKASAENDEKVRGIPARAPRAQPSLTATHLRLPPSKRRSGSSWRRRRP